LNREDDAHSWLMRFRQFLQFEPQSLQDLIHLLRHAKARTLIDSQTLAMVEGVLQLAQLKVRDIMLPKKQMTWISESDSFSDILNIVTQSGHSRFPVSGSHKDEIIGILHAKDLLRFQKEQTSSFDVHELVRKATIIPESKRLDLLLSEFRKTRNHMAIVVDEYGTVSGFITLEDIIEQIIGDIEDEFDIDEEAYIKAHGQNQFIVKAHTPIEIFNETLDSHFSDEGYDTIGGIVTARLGHLPQRGEHILIEGFMFTILHADMRGIKLIECIDQRISKNSEV
jgi:magnesium and cobalt transporter